MVFSSPLVVNIAALSEALVLAKRAGVDPRAVVAAIRGGLAGSKVLEQKAEKMLANEFLRELHDGNLLPI